MRNLVSSTGVPSKSPGDGLTADDINRINNAVNTDSEIVNDYLKSFFNMNMEMGNYAKSYNLTTAIANVPADRRCGGLEIRFLTAKGRYVSFVYSGPGLENEDWLNEDNWRPLMTAIDGGEW